MSAHNLFNDAAAQVRNRISMQRLSRWLSKSHWWIGGIAVVAVLLSRVIWQWRSGEIWLVVGLLIIWLFAGVLLTLRARPNSLRALAEFDRRGDWQEQFSSALFFIEKERATIGEQLHINKASQRLPKAMESLRDVVPIASLKWVGLLPIIAIVFSLSPVFRHSVEIADQALSEEMKQAASGESDAIRRTTEGLGELAALDADEQAELEQLKSGIQEAADALSAPAEDQTTRELLTALESRARAAEQLAEKLGLANDQWASEELVRALGQYADTADLAIGIKDKAPELVSSQANEIAGIFSQPDIKQVTLDRWTIALERASAKVDEADLKREIGQAISNAASSLGEQNIEQAADEFRQLANYFSRVNQRTQAQQKLQRIAAQLRSSGSQITGSQLGCVKQVDISQNANVQDGLQPIESLPIPPQLDSLLSPPQPEPAGINSDLAQLSAPIPGASENTTGSNDATAQKAGEKSQSVDSPIPGEASKNDNASNSQSGKTGSELGQGGGLLSAPIPGETKASALNSKLAGDANQSGPGIGGNKAGGAKMDLFEQKDSLTKASKDSRVNTQILDEGDSVTRAVERKDMTPEQARVKRREIMREFIDTEEQALDEQPLPLSRRNQVLRYFSELRKQLETGE